MYKLNHEYIRTYVVSYLFIYIFVNVQTQSSLLHSAIMCIRGSRSSSGHPFKGHVPASVDLALGEGRLGAV